MKWEKYNRMSVGQKEEYNYRFTRVINDLFDLMLLTIGLIILGLLNYQIINDKIVLASVFYITLGLWVISIIIIIVSIKKFLWLKKRGI